LKNYGQIKPVFDEILGIKKVTHKISGPAVVYDNVFEAGYFANYAEFREVGYAQLLTVIGRVEAQIESPGLPRFVNDRRVLIDAIGRFREACKYYKGDLANEHEVQDVFWVMLRPLFEKLRRDEALPKLGEKQYKPDFLIPELNTLIEVKYIGQATQTASIQDELLTDAVAYLKASTSYTSLIIIIYDAASKLRDGTPLKEELSTIPNVTNVFIFPKI